MTTSDKADLPADLEELVAAEARRLLVRDQLAQCDSVEELKTWLATHLVRLVQERIE